MGQLPVCVNGTDNGMDRVYGVRRVVERCLPILYPSIDYRFLSICTGHEG
jgi:hypothetical protein